MEYVNLGKTDIKVSVLVDERVPETGLVDSTEDIIKAILTEDYRFAEV